MNLDIADIEMIEEQRRTLETSIINLTKRLGSTLQVLERKIEPRKVISESAVTKHLKESNGNRVQRDSVVVENTNTETVETENFVDIEKIIASAGLAKKKFLIKI